MKVNLYFGGGKAWSNVVGDMARRVIRNAPMEIFTGTDDAQGDIVHYADIGPLTRGHRPGVASVHHISERIPGRSFETLRPYLQRCYHVFTVNNAYADMIKTVNKRVSVVPAGVDERFRPMEGMKHDERPTVITCGANRKADHKGNDCRRKIMKKLPLLRYLFMGSGWGPEVEWAKSEGIDAVEWSGDYSTYHEGYNSADVYLCTSREDGGHIPILEATACGLPVVSTPVGYANDLDHPALWKFPFLEGSDFEGDADKGAEALQWALTSEIPVENITACVKDYTWERYQSAHYELYKGFGL